MNKKRFRVNDLVKYVYSDIGEHIDEKHTDIPLRNDELCKLLNELSEENEQLRKDKAQLKERLRECRIKMDKFNCR